MRAKKTYLRSQVKVLLNILDLEKLDKLCLGKYGELNRSLYFRYLLKKEIGEKQFNNIFEISEPIAAASIAQVHFAKINNNGVETEVAVKILRPQIEKIIEQEMSRLEWLTSFMEKFKEFERLRPNSIIKKAKEVIKFELDLRYEAAAASELKENTQLDGSFYVPIVYWEKITQKILS